MESITIDEAREIVAWARSKGSNAKDLRDAVHETVHGLAFVRGNGLDLRRSEINARIELLMDRGRRFESECLARATEALACRLAGEVYPFDFYALTTMVEASKSGVLKDFSAWTAGIAAQERAAVKMLDRIRRAASRGARRRAAA